MTFLNSNELSLDQRDFIMSRMEKLLYPLYHKLHSGAIDTASFEQLARHSQEAIIATPNGYHRFIKDITENDHKGQVIISIMANFKSALMLQFGRTVLEQLEKDLFRFSVQADDLAGGVGLSGLPGESSGTYQQFDGLTSYFFLHFLKYYVYNLTIDPVKAREIDERDSQGKK